MPEKALIFIFNAHLAYERNEILNNTSIEDYRFFDFLSYSMLPFLRMCQHLATDSVVFRCGLVLSPFVCEMLKDELMQEQYLAFLDKRIAFGKTLLERSNMAEISLDSLNKRIVFFEQNRKDFIDIHSKNVLKTINHFVVEGFIELLATAATAAFFPFYYNMPEALIAQIETGLASYREYFTIAPTGFWLPSMGYAEGIDKIIKRCGFDYTVLESQSFLFALNTPSSGVFLPLATDSGLCCFGKDNNACIEIMDTQRGFYKHTTYLDTNSDIGFSLDKSILSSLFAVEEGRRFTGFCYKNRTGFQCYNSAAAMSQVKKDAQLFLNSRLAVFKELEQIVSVPVICSVCAVPLEFMGLTWFEGVDWLESVFRDISSMSDTVRIALPTNYLGVAKQNSHIQPFYASSLPSGYADELINNNNDWMFSSVQKATKQMIDMANRFPDETGLKKRILNTAAKEILFAQSMDWPLLAGSTNKEFAAACCKEHITAFTEAYDAMGSGSISTEWLVSREKKYPVFSDIDYRFFLTKKA